LFRTCWVNETSSNNKCVAFDGKLQLSTFSSLTLERLTLSIVHTVFVLLAHRKHSLAEFCVSWPIRTVTDGCEIAWRNIIFLHCFNCPSFRVVQWCCWYYLLNFLGVLTWLEKVPFSFVMGPCLYDCMAVHMYQHSSHWMDFHHIDIVWPFMKICWENPDLFNPFPVQFKSLVPGQKSRVFSRDI